MSIDVLETRKRLLRDFIRRVWDEGDAGAAVDYLARNYHIHHDPGDPWEGQTLDLRGFQERLAVSRAAFPDQKFDIQGLFTSDDAVVMTWLWAGTHLGDIPGFPATGDPIRMSGATAYVFNADNRLCGHWQVTDRLSVVQQLMRASRTG